MEKSMRRFYGLVQLIGRKTGGKDKIYDQAGIIEDLPEGIFILISELNAAVKLFNRLRKEKKLDKVIFINAGYLMEVLRTDQLLPKMEFVLKDKVNNELIIKELGRFRFINRMKSWQLLSALFLAYYRTYTLVKYPLFREKNAQVASSLEEMLAILALEGINTNLFQASKHWILDWKKEGFSRTLAYKIKKLK